MLVVWQNVSIQPVLNMKMTKRYISYTILSNRPLDPEILRRDSLHQARFQHHGSSNHDIIVDTERCNVSILDGVSSSTRLQQNHQCDRDHVWKTHQSELSKPIWPQLYLYNYSAVGKRTSCCVGIPVGFSLEFPKHSGRFFLPSFQSFKVAPLFFWKSFTLY